MWTGSEKQIEAARKNIAHARSFITAESRKKQSISSIGHIPWNKGKKTGIKPWLGKKRPDMTGEKHFAWKENPHKTSLHDWVKRYLGKPSLCEHCGTTTAKRFEWANKSQEYKRDLSDWIRLCPSCHHIYDNTLGKAWETRRKRLASGELQPVGYKNIWKGRKCPTSKLTLEQVTEIRLLLSKGVMCKEIAPIFNVQKSTISHIKMGRTWKIGVHS